MTSISFPGACAALGALAVAGLLGRWIAGGLFRLMTRSGQPPGPWSRLVGRGRRVADARRRLGFLVPRHATVRRIAIVLLVAMAVNTLADPAMAIGTEVDTPGL